MTEFLFEAITAQKVAPNLRYLDINMIKNIKADPLEEFRRANPKLIARRFMFQEALPKDNGL